jgi:hypothetical protein
MKGYIREFDKDTCSARLQWKTGSAVILLSSIDYDSIKLAIDSLCNNILVRASQRGDSHMGLSKAIEED